MNIPNIQLQQVSTAVFQGILVQCAIRTPNFSLAKDPWTFPWRLELILLQQVQPGTHHHQSSGSRWLQWATCFEIRSGVPWKSRMLESERLFSRPYPGLFIFHQQYWNSKWRPRSWPLNKHMGAWSSRYSFHVLLGVQKLSELQQNLINRVCAVLGPSQPAGLGFRSMHWDSAVPIPARAASRRPPVLPLGPSVQVGVGSPLGGPCSPTLAAQWAHVGCKVWFCAVSVCHAGLSSYIQALRWFWFIKKC